MITPHEISEITHNKTLLQTHFKLCKILSKWASTDCAKEKFYYNPKSSQISSVGAWKFCFRMGI